MIKTKGIQYQNQFVIKEPKHIKIIHFFKQDKNRKEKKSKNIQSYRQINVILSYIQELCCLIFKNEYQEKTYSSSSSSSSSKAAKALKALVCLSEIISLDQQL